MFGFRKRSSKRKSKGSTAPVRLSVERLERRDMLSVSMGWSGSTLQLIGDKGGVVANDMINVDISNGRVWFSGSGLASQSVPASSVGQIDIAGRSGNDNITVTQREAFDRLIRLFGESGDDRMTLDIQSDSVGRYHADGGKYGRDVVVVPNRMPGGPNAFPQSLTTWDVEVRDIGLLAQYQGALRDYGIYPQMNQGLGGQLRNPAAPFRVGLTERTAERYRLAITQFEVTHRRYQWDSYGTKCNVFAGDVLRAMGAPLPTKDEWNRAGYPGNYGTGDVTITTPALSSWLNAANGAAVRGWRKIDLNSQADLDYLLNVVRQGYPAIAFSPPPPGGTSGHIAVVRPDQNLARLTRDQIPNLIVAQAGGKIVGGRQVTNNFSRGRIADGWASTASIQLFVNVGQVSLESFNYPGYRIRHRNSETFIDRVDGSDLFRLDSSFRPVQGLADPSAISFESVNYPGYFLRHRNYRWVLDRNDGSDLFRADATFYTRPGLATAGGVSFESFNYRGHYLRHRNYEIWLDRNDGSNLFKHDATFLPVW